MTDRPPETSEPERSSPPVTAAERVWPVFAAWLMAFVAIVIFSAFAAALLASTYPDVAPAALLRELPGLLAGATASSMGLIVTCCWRTGASTPRGCAWCRDARPVVTSP